MLKSHLRIGMDNEEEEEEEIEDAPTATGVSIPEEEHDEVLVLPFERVLNKSEISVRLSWLGKTGAGDGYAYLKVSLVNMALTNINVIKCFQYLQFVNVSQNELTIDTLQPVTELPHLLLIEADKNLLKEATLNKCKFLQVMIMNNNSINSVENVYQPELSTLEVGYNEITEIKFLHRMPSIRVLDFRYNAIHDVLNMNFPNLDSLYLAGNKITNLTGIETLQNLRLLHVRNNPIRFLNGFETTLPKLKYLNLRNCKIGTLRQVKKLKPQTALETLILKGTPYMGGSGKEEAEAAAEEEDPELRIEVLAALQRLKILNKTEFTPEERLEAKDLATQWMEEGDKDDEEEIVEEHGEEMMEEMPQ